MTTPRAPGHAGRRDRLVRAAVAASRVQGCTCDVEVIVERTEADWWDARACHDDWCPLLVARGNGHGRN